MGNAQGGPRGLVVKEGVVDKHSVEQKMGQGKWNRYNFVLYENGLIDIKRPFTGGISRTVKVDGSSEVKPMIATDKRGRSLFVINKLIYTNKDKEKKRANMFVFAPTERERESWMKEIKRIILKLGGKKRAPKAALSSHVVKFTAKDAQKFMAMQDASGQISEQMYKDAHHKIATYMKKASPSKKPAGLEDLGIGAFMFKSLVSRSSRKPKKKRPKRPPRKIKSNKKISTRATDYLKTKGLTDVDRKKIKQQQRGHVMVAKLAAKSRRRMNQQKNSRAKQSRSAPYVLVLDFKKHKLNFFKHKTHRLGKKIAASTRSKERAPPVPSPRSRSSPSQRPVVVKPSTPKPKISNMSWKPRKVTKPKSSLEKKGSGKPRLRTPTKNKRVQNNNNDEVDATHERQMAAKERQRKKLEERRRRKLEREKSMQSKNDKERDEALRREKEKKELETQRKREEEEEKLKRRKREEREKREEEKEKRRREEELKRQKREEEEEKLKRRKEEELKRRKREEEEEKEKLKREKERREREEELKREQSEREENERRKREEDKQRQNREEKEEQKVAVSDKEPKQRQRKRKKRLSRKVKKTVEEIETMLRTKGFNLHRDCSNFDRKTGKTTMEGSVKCGAKFKDNAYVIFLYKKPNAVGGLDMTKEKMRSEIADYKYMRDAGLPLPEIYSDVFDCKVNGTKTFGFLVEVVHTSMADPYKPQAHKMTYKFIQPALDDLDYDQLQRALNDLEMIGEYTKNVHFVHDLQLLCQDSAPDEEENGRIFVIDPGELRKPKKNQMRVLQRKIAKMMTKR